MKEGHCNSVWPSPCPDEGPGSPKIHGGTRRSHAAVRVLLALLVSITSLAFSFAHVFGQLQFQVKGSVRIPIGWTREDSIPLPGGVTGAVGIGLDQLGRVLILDAPTGRVWALDPGRRSPAPFGASDQGSERFEMPTRVFARWGLHVYTLDPQRRLVSVFDLEGRYAGSFDLEKALDEGDGPLDVEFVDLVVDKGGSLIALDRLEGRILLFDSEGRYRGLLGEDLTGRERPVAPTDLEVDDVGTLYIADPPTGRVLRVGRQGSLEQVWTLRSEDRPESRPVALAYSDGAIFAADEGEGRIAGLTLDGREFLEIRPEDGSPLGISAGTGLIVTKQGKLLLLNPEGQQILSFQLDYKDASR